MGTMRYGVTLTAERAPFVGPSSDLPCVYGMEEVVPTSLQSAILT